MVGEILALRYSQVHLQSSKDIDLARIHLLVKLFLRTVWSGPVGPFLLTLMSAYYSHRR